MSLSNRINETLGFILPMIKLQLAQKCSTTPLTDLGTAENWLVRDELVEFFRRAVYRNLSSKDLSYQKGFAGDPELIDSLRDFINIHFSPSQFVDSSNICVGPGCGAILESFLTTVCDEGDAMLVMAPFWNGFHFQFRSQPKVKIVPVNAPDEALFNGGVVHYLQQALISSQDCIKGVIICNPHNPIGQCYTQEALCEIAMFCERHNLHLLSDEIYSLSTYKTHEVDKVTPFISMLDFDLKRLNVSSTRVHVIWGVSKDFCCSGLRLGAFISRNKEAVLGVAATSNTQVSSLTALSVKKLLRNKAYLSKIMNLNRARLAMAYMTVSVVFRNHSIQHYPAYAGIFIWAKLSQKVRTWDEEARLAQAIERQRVVVSQGKSYSAFEPGWYRLSFAIPPRELKKALLRMVVGIQKFEKDVI